MILGIKVGPQRQSFLDLETTNASFAEVWFDINRAGEYTQLFAELKRRQIQVGLHFWGALPDGTWANIAYPDTELINASMKLMRQTVDIAAQNSFQYVNIHPGCQAKVSLSFPLEEFVLLSHPAPLETSLSVFLENLRQLYEYATQCGVVFTVETVPARVTKGWYNPGSRITPCNIYQLSIKAIEQAVDHRFWVANDFGHTAAIIADSPKTVWTHLKEKTQTLAQRTRLIHLGFVVPPYNGTDFHDHLDNPLLETSQAVPNRSQMIELLKLFQDRPDVWILCEPNGEHTKNYFLAQKILEEAGI